MSRTDVLPAKDIPDSAFPPVPGLAAPDLAGAKFHSEHSSLVDKAYNLYWTLQENGNCVDPDEFCARYPTVQNTLAQLIRAHQFLEAHCELFDVDQHINWPRPPDRFAGFNLVSELGRGAFARVFLAVEPALGGRQVAVKISAHGSAEAATLGRIAHANIVPVFSVAEDKSTGLYGVCMPYLGRATLLTVLDHVYGKRDLRPNAHALLEAVQDPTMDKPVRIPAALRRGTYVDGVRWLAVQLADALVFIHAKGICHRDLKPSNILVLPDGTPMLLDFNLAEDAQNPISREGGTPTYMAPEQLESLICSAGATNKIADSQSDLFSLGVILYELLTGKHPFGPLPLATKGRELAPLLAERQRQGFRPIKELRPEVDAAFARVVENCLALDPQRRPAHAGEVAGRLHRSQGFRARSARWLVRRRRYVVAAALFLITLGTVGAASLLTRLPEHEAQMLKGTEAALHGDYRLAIDHFTESLKAQPKQPQALFARGKAHLKLAATDRVYYSLALGDFLDAEQLEPRGEFKAFIGYCCFKQQDILAAIHFYKAAIQAGLQTAEVYNNLGHLYLERAEFENGRENLEQALGIKPKLQVAEYNLAVLFYRKATRAKDGPLEEKEALNEAHGHFRRALDVGPLTGNMLLLGAGIAVRLSAFDEDFNGTTLDYLSSAVDQGIDPKQLLGNLTFARICATPGFQALLQRSPPVNHPPIAAICCVEPCQ